MPSSPNFLNPKLSGVAVNVHTNGPHVYLGISSGRDLNVQQMNAAQATTIAIALLAAADSVLREQRQPSQISRVLYALARECSSRHALTGDDRWDVLREQLGSYGNLTGSASTM